MSDLKEAESEILLVSPHELDEETISEAIWESFIVHDSIDDPEGAHDPEVWEAIHDPESPAKVFVLETATGRAHVVRHLGEIGTISALAS